MADEINKPKDFMSLNQTTNNNKSKEAPKESTTNQKTNDLVNNSGQGAGTPVLDIVKKHFNFAAFIFNWIWGVANNTYIPLLIIPAALLYFIPIIGPLLVIGIQIWFGIKGNEWAWQNKQWDSVEDFLRVQKRWNIAGYIFFFVPAVIGSIIVSLSFLLILGAPLSNSSEKVKIEYTIKREISALNQAFVMNYALNRKNKQYLTSDGLASIVAERVPTYIAVNETTLKVADRTPETHLEFYGDGVCQHKGDCYVKLKIKNRKNKVIEEILPIVVNDGIVDGVDGKDVIEKYSNKK